MVFRTADLLEDPPGGDNGQPAAEQEQDDAPAGFPRLLVDWGVAPRVGHQLRPRCILVCPAGWDVRPCVEVAIDPLLDNHLATGPVELTADGDGLWEFHAPFSMTTRNDNCRPGQYLVQVRVAFRGLQASRRARYFTCTIRLDVADSSQSERTLEIDGDGQSIINLHGQDLQSFGRVVLRGGESGIVNLQGPLDSGTGASPEPAATSLTHEYQLSVDEARESQVIGVMRRPRPIPMDRAVLVDQHGRQILLLPRRRVTLGRQRNSDIIIRCLPRNASHDRLSRKISRTHLVLTLEAEHLLLTDSSSRGVFLDGERLDGDRALDLDEGQDPLEFRFGGGGQPPAVLFGGRLQLFGNEAATGDPEGDTARWEAVGEQPSRLWQLAAASRIDTARIRRVTNLAGREEYVLLFRQACIGSSADRSAITVSGTDIPPVAARVLYMGRSFWLENLAAPEVLSLDGKHLPLRQLAPLLPGSLLEIGSARLQFGHAAQLMLENSDSM